MPSKSPRLSSGPQRAKVVPKRRRCLGFGNEHSFWSTDPGHRRCPKCERRFADLKLAPACERPVSIPSDCNSC